MLKVLVLSLYNSVLNTCARDSRKRRRHGCSREDHGVANENVCAQQFLSHFLIHFYLAFASNVGNKFSTRILNSERLHDENVCITQR